jgi:hypothetical protein
VIVVKCHVEQFFIYIMVRTSCDNDDVRFLLDQHASLRFLFSLCSLKQQSAGRYIAPFERIIQILSQTSFTLTP